MENRTTSGAVRAIGLDLGDRYSHLCVLDDAGEIEEEGRVRTEERTLRERFGRMNPTRIAIEAGTHSPWVSRLLKACGHEVLVANPRKLRMIYENESKSDTVDARWLARIARMDPALLSPIEHRSEQDQADLEILRARDALVRARTILANHARGAAKSFGKRIPKCSVECLPQRAVGQIPPALSESLTPVLDTIAVLTKGIRRYDRQIATLARTRHPQAKRPRQVKGVGPLTSMAYVLTLGDPRRFRRSRDVGSFLGLRPRRKESGSLRPQLRITKAGDSFVRSLLVESAQYILGPFGPPTDLREWGRKLAERGGKNGKKRAIVAVARKLAVLLHRLWVSGAPYEPLRQATRKDATRKQPA